MYIIAPSPKLCKIQHMYNESLTDVYTTLAWLGITFFQGCWYLCKLSFTLALCKKKGCFLNTFKSKPLDFLKLWSENKMRFFKQSASSSLDSFPLSLTDNNVFLSSLTCGEITAHQVSKGGGMFCCHGKCFPFSSEDCHGRWQEWR